MSTQLPSYRLYKKTSNKSRPTILLVHGMAANSHYWDGVLSHLENHFDVLLMDVPGSGLNKGLPHSTIDDLVRPFVSLLSHLDIQHCVAVGHSLGAGIVCHLASESSVVSRLIIVNGHLFRAQEILQRPLSAWRSPLTAASLVALTTAASVPFRGLIGNLLSRQQVTRKLAFAALAKRPGNLDPKLLQDAFAQNFASNIVPTLLALRDYALSIPDNVPVSLIWGVDDVLLSHSDLASARERLHPVSQHAIQDAGHWALLEVPIEVAGLIRAEILDGATSV